MQYLRYLHVADRMLLRDQFPGDRPRALANPAQRRLRISARLLVDQSFERLNQRRIRLRQRPAARSGATHTADHRLGPALKFYNALADCLARRLQARLTRDTPP